MPDFTLMGAALLVSAVTAALTLLVVAWPPRTPHPLRLRIAWVLALGAGIYAGCGVLGMVPRWPIPEDRDRFLVVLLPLTLAVEIAAAANRPRWLALLLRLTLAASAAPILLYNSVYLVDLSGPHSAEWPPHVAAVILFGLAAALALLWELLALLQARTVDRPASAALALTTLAAGATVMLSGYYQGGLMAMPLVGAGVGVTLASFAAPARPNTSCPPGVGVVGLFTVLLIGRFFGALPTDLALCLLFAPLLAWVSEAPGLRLLRPSLRGAARLVLVALPLVPVVAKALARFNEASAARFGP
jgi:hypothetical protein